GVMRRISINRITGSKPPRMLSISFKPFGVFDGIVTMNQCLVAVQHPIVRIPIFQSARIQPQVRLVSPEQRPDTVAFRHIVLEDQRMPVPVGGRLDRATACAAFVVYLGWNTVGWRGGSKDVGNEAFIIAPYGVVSDPARRRAPVPIQHMLTVLSVP